MMVDIVEQLRMCGDCISNYAAAEIERLRAQLARGVAYARERVALVGDLAEANAEIKRLRAELEAAQEAAYAGWAAATGVPIAEWVFEYHPWLQGYVPKAARAAGGGE